MNDMTPLQKEQLTEFTDNVDDIRKNKNKLKEFRRLKWGSYGRQGERKSPVYKNIEDLDTNHIENIMINQRHYDARYAIAFLDILKERYSRNYVSIALSYLVGFVSCLLIWYLFGGA